MLVVVPRGRRDLLRCCLASLCVYALRSVECWLPSTRRERCSAAAVAAAERATTTAARSVKGSFCYQARRHHVRKREASSEPFLTHMRRVREKGKFVFPLNAAQPSLLRNLYKIHTSLYQRCRCGCPDITITMTGHQQRSTPTKPSEERRYVAPEAKRAVVFWLSSFRRLEAFGE